MYIKSNLWIINPQQDWDQQKKKKHDKNIKY